MKTKKHILKVKDALEDGKEHALKDEIKEEDEKKYVFKDEIEEDEAREHNDISQDKALQPDDQKEKETLEPRGKSLRSNPSGSTASSAALPCRLPYGVRTDAKRAPRERYVKARAALIIAVQRKMLRRNKRSTYAPSSADAVVPPCPRSYQTPITNDLRNRP
ncbi:hypothetical protein N7530_005269 [Penicillium desertorum]|uniref:Uncharacterized protein n=1 Tax=Penicillium desertorum TaxID=1303715 RepID=A0A9W9WZR6_9EURO|nr:hypothetical protein N7530_005269 [Penicillium desertorum]